MAFRWLADDGPTLSAGLGLHGIRTSIAMKLYFLYFCDFSRGGGGSGPPFQPSVSAHVCHVTAIAINNQKPLNLRPKYISALKMF